MPVYFFDINDGSGWVRDNEGSSLENALAARREATETLAQIGTELFPGLDGHALNADVRTEDGAVILRVSISLCVTTA